MMATAADAKTPRPAMQPHRFKVKTFTSPTFCDVCHKLMWGLVRQGLCCQKCHSTTHFKCIENAPSCPGVVPPRSRSATGSSSSSSSTPADQPGTMDDEQIHRHPSIHEQRVTQALAQVIPTETMATIQKVQQHEQQRAITATPEPAPASSSSTSKPKLSKLVGDIITSTSKHAARLEKARREPSLNLLTTTPKNMTRFVTRVGFLRATEAAIKDILSWRNKTLTLLCLSVFTLLCLYPFLLVIAPQVLIAQHLAVQYYERAKREATSGTKASSKKIVDTDPAPKLKPSEYKDNLQWIQNFMGFHCELYDTTVLFSREYLSWDFPENAMITLQLLAASTIPLFLIVYYVPLNLLVMFGGWGIFLGNTPLVMGLRETMTPVLLEILNENWEAVCSMARRWPEVMKVKPKRTLPMATQQQYDATGHSDSEQLNISPATNDEQHQQQEAGVYMVAMYENQRWWLGLGFINYLLSSERPAWSDYSGSVPLPPQSSYTPPPGFEWLDASWQIDRTWSLVPTDNEGWVYSDHHWQRPRSSSSVGALTRRRKWVRRVKRLSDDDKHADTVPVAHEFAHSTQSASSPSTDEKCASPTSSHTLFRETAPAADMTASAPIPAESAAIPEIQVTHAAGSNDAKPVSSSAPPSIKTPSIPASDSDPVLTSERSAPMLGETATMYSENSQYASEGEHDNNQNGDEIEYILELDGEEIVLEGVRSLDMVDMDKLRSLVAVMKEQQAQQLRNEGQVHAPSSPSAAAHHVHRVRVE